MQINLKETFLKFVKETSGKKLMPYQIRIALRILKSVWIGDGEEIAVLVARQAGKTEAVALGPIAFLCFAVILYWKIMPSFHERFHDGLRILIFSPKGEQGEVDLSRARRTLTSQMLKKMGLHIESDNNSRFEVHEKGKIKTRVVFVIKAISASETSQIESDTADLIIIEEAQDVSNKKYQAEIEPMGAARNATRVYVGTVGFKRDMFYEACQRIKAKSPENYFDVIDDEVIGCNFGNGRYKLYVDSMIAKYGAESDYYRMKFKNQWILERGHPFSGQQFRNKLCNPNYRRFEYCHELPDKFFLVAGLDVGKDYDDSVLRVGTADYRNVDYKLNLYPEIVPRFSQEWHGTKYEDQIAEMDVILKQRFPLVKRHGVIAIDATGDRGDMTARFENLGYTAIGFEFTTGSKTGKGLLCQQFMNVVETRHFFLPTGEEEFVGSDFYYNFKIPDGHNVLPMDKIFKKVRDQYSGLIREYVGPRLNIRSAEESVGDDYPITDMLLTHAAIMLMETMVDVTQIKKIGQRTVTAPLQEEVLKSENEWPLGGSDFSLQKDDSFGFGDDKW